MKRMLAGALAIFAAAAGTAGAGTTLPGYLTLGATPVPLGGALGTASAPLTGLYTDTQTILAELVLQPRTGGNAAQINMVGTNGAWATGIDVASAHAAFQSWYLFKCHSAANCTSGHDVIFGSANGYGLNSPAVVGGGSGYSDGCIITLAGGTNPDGTAISTPAKLVVNAGGQSGGTIQPGGVSIAYVSSANNYGMYGTVPGNPISQASATCGGTGATFSATQQDNLPSFRIGVGSDPDMAYQIRITPDNPTNAGMGGLLIQGATTAGPYLKINNVTFGDLFNVAVTSNGQTHATVTGAASQAAFLDFAISGGTVWQQQATSGSISFLNVSTGKTWLKDTSFDAVTIGATNGLQIGATGGLKAPGIATSGTPNGSVCAAADGTLYVKTSSGACL